ncbi:MAG: tandem-95 repeat protein [Planctomycetota bacterium]
MRQHLGSINVSAVPGNDIADREVIQFTDDLFNPVQYESIVGRDIVFPSGAELSVGDTVQVTGPDGVTLISFVNAASAAPPPPGEVVFDAGMTREEIAAAVVASVPTSLSAYQELGGRVSFLAASDVSVDANIAAGQANPVEFDRVGAALIEVPDGDQAFAGEVLNVVGPTGTVTSLTYTDVDNAIPPATFVPGEIFFADGDSKNTIARRILEQLPSDVQAFIDVNDDIVLANTLSTAAVDAGASFITINQQAANESRFILDFPQGSALNDGETITLTSIDGLVTRTLTFVDGNGFDFPGDGFIPFNENANNPTPASVIAERVVNDLGSEFFDFVRDDEVYVIASSVTRAVEDTNIVAGGLPTQRISFPDGAGLQDGESITINSNAGPITINFAFSATETVDVAGRTVFFNNDPLMTTTATDIASRALSVVQSNVSVDEALNGSSITFYGAAGVALSSLTSQIDATAIGGQQITFPNGNQITDGETLTITDATNIDVVFTFVENGVTGGTTIGYTSLANNAAAIATDALSVLSAYLPVVRSGAGNQIGLTANNAVAGSVTSSIDVTSQPFNDVILDINFPTGDLLRDGEIIEITSAGETFTVMLRDAGEPGPIDTPVDFFILFDDASTPQQIGNTFASLLNTFELDYQAYVDPTGDGVRLAAPGSTAFVSVSPTVTGLADDAEVDTYAIPITFPSGDQIIEGESFTIFDRRDPYSQAPLTYTLVTGTPANAFEIQYDVADDAATVAQKVAAGLDPELRGIVVNGREVHVLTALSVEVNNLASFIVSHAATVDPNVSFRGDIRPTPILVDATFGTRQVASAMQEAFARGFGGFEAFELTDSTFTGEVFESTAEPELYKLYGGDFIRLYRATVDDAGSYGASQRSISNGLEDRGIGYFTRTALPADEFGTFPPVGIVNSEVETEPAEENTVEGLYIDDIIVGFAERGEIVINSPTNVFDYVFDPSYLPETHPQSGSVNTLNGAQPERANEVLVGGYSLEVRTSDEYGVPQDYNPINLLITEDLGLGRSFDTNDRLVDGAVTLILPAGQDLIDLGTTLDPSVRQSDRFVLDDGITQVTFEFDSILDSGQDRVEQGNVLVPFDPSSDDPAETAAAVRDAINSLHDTDLQFRDQQTLRITAATNDDREQGASTGSRVELFGDNVLVNPSVGRFVKLDLVAEETFAGRITSERIALVDHQDDTVEYGVYQDELANGVVSGYTNGLTDTLVGIGKIGDAVRSDLSTGDINDDNAILGTNPELDFDTVRIYLDASDTIDIDVDTAGFTRANNTLEVPVITVFQDGAVLSEDLRNLSFVTQTSLFFASSAPGETDGGAFLQFSPAAFGLGSGFYDVVISSPAVFGTGPISFTDEQTGEYSLTIRPTTDPVATSEIPDRDVLMVDYHFGTGDVNRTREQGQIIISSNFITDSAEFGISATSGARGQAFTSVGPDQHTRPGSARLLRNDNPTDLIPGAVIINNVVADSGSGGIQFSGGTFDDGESPAPNLFGRIVNNTVVGGSDGILIDGRANPTVINNIIAEAGTGLNVNTVTSNDTIVAANVYYNNGTDSTLPLASSSYVIDPSIELFQEPGRGIYIPVDASDVIDDSIGSIPDRSVFFDTVKSPVGISASPILAPSFDVYGQPRVDGGTGGTGGGTGLNPFIDRGALDRADDRRPIALLTSPFDAEGDAAAQNTVFGDTDEGYSFVRLVNREETVEFFEVQLVDPSGTGPDPATITVDSVLLTENGRRLLPDLDFTFGYSANSRTIRLTPLAGLWRQDAVYEITLNNQPRQSFDVLAGDQIADGDQVTLVDTQGRATVFEFESGYTLQVPSSSTFTVTGAPNQFVDNDTFTITSFDGLETFTFEINLEGSTGPQNVEIDLQTAGTITEVRNAILAVFNSVIPGDTRTYAEALDLVPQAIGFDSLQLGTLAGDGTNPGHVVNLSGGTTMPGLTLSGVIGGVVDGESFSYTTAGRTVSFEFDRDATVVETDALRPVTFTRTDTADDIATSIIAAVRAAGLGLDLAQATGAGRATLGGQIGDVLDTTLAPSLAQTGSPDVTGSLQLTVPANATDASLDDTTFTLTVGGVAEVFRYTTNPNATGTERFILLTAGDDADAIAAATADRIEEVFRDELEPVADANVITLGEAPAAPAAGDPRVVTSFTAGTSTLTRSGISGGAIAVPFLPSASFSEAAVASLLQIAIGDSNLEYSVFSPGGGTLLIDGASSIVGQYSGQLVPAVGLSIPAVSDLAGNAVRETRTENETRFTIIMPEVRFDFGDAPVTYATLLQSPTPNLLPTDPGFIPGNGARHAVINDGAIRLGAHVDVEVDGQPAPGQSDDALNSIRTGLLRVNETVANQLTLDFNAVPRVGQVFELTVDATTFGFEFIAPGDTPTGGNAGVVINPGDSLTVVTLNLVASMAGALLVPFPDIDVETPTGQNQTIRITDTLGVSTLSVSEPTSLVVTPGAPGVVQVQFTSIPQSGEQFVVTLGGVATVYEFVDPATNPQPGNQAVNFNNASTPETLASAFAAALQANLFQAGRSITAGVDPNAASTVLLTAVDDEDGLSIGTYSDAGLVDYELFIAPGATAPFSPLDVLGYLNPLDPAGANIAIEVAGGGLLNGWVDFDLDGEFEEEERILSNRPVVDGLNTVTVFTPSDAGTGVDPSNAIAFFDSGRFAYNTWARFRLSDSATSDPSGVAVGGEVEDYVLTVLPIGLPTPEAKTYTAIEDTELEVTPATVAANDLLVTPDDRDNQILPVRYFVGDEPQNGSLEIVFDYQIFGIDTSVIDNVGVTLLELPRGGENLVFTINGTPITFELIGDGGVAAGANIPVPFLETESLEEVVANLQSAIALEMQSSAPTVTVSLDANDPTRINLVDTGATGTLDADAPLLAEGDDLTGAFRYTPDPDFYGVDTFTYRLSTQQNLSPSTLAQAEFVTVTINVLPDNDAPGADPSAKQFVTIEPSPDPNAPTTLRDGQLLIDPADLVTQAVPDADPMITTSPQDESNQEIFVASISVGTTTINAGNPNAVLTTPQGGSLEASFDATRGVITQIIYTPADDFNSDNGAAIDQILLDEFTFTLIDDGESIFPDDLRNNFVNGQIPDVPAGLTIRQLPDGTYVGDQFDENLGPFSNSATAFIRVTPQNDAPVLQDDYVGLTDATGAANTAYTDYFTNQSLSVVVPTEDTVLVFPSDYLVQNDVNAPATATDELTAFNGNDGAVVVSDVQLVDPTQGTITLDTVTGNIIFTPAADVYGEVRFRYVATDAGTNEGTDVGDVTDVNDRGTRTPASLSATAEATIFIEPVNDVPVAYDRRYRTSEDTPITLTAAQILAGTTSTVSSIVATPTAVTLPDADAIVNGETLILTAENGRQLVIEFSTASTPSLGSDAVLQITTGETADQLAARLQTLLRSFGFGGTATGATVSFDESDQIGAVAAGVSIVIDADGRGARIPSGSVLNDGEVLVLTDSTGAQQTIVFSKTGQSAIADALIVPFSEADSSESIATALANLLFSQGISASAMATGQVTTRAVVTDATEITTTAFGFTVVGNEVVPPAGNALANNSVLRIQTPAGESVVEFTNDGNTAQTNPIVVLFDVTDTAVDIIASLVAALNTAGVNASTATTVDWRVDTVNQTVTVNDVTSMITVSGQDVTIPSTDQLIAGETITITDDAVPSGSVLVEFNTTGTITDVADVAVVYDVNGTAEDVVINLAAALIPFGISSVLAGDTLTLRALPAAGGLAGNAAASNIQIAGTDILVPSGAELFDGQQLRIQDLGGGTETLVEFSLTGVSTTGADVIVTYSAGDSAQTVAFVLQEALRASGFGAIADLGRLGVIPGLEPVSLQVIDTTLVGELPAAPGAFDPRLGLPFNEAEQTPDLRIVTFTTGAGTVDVDTLPLGTTSTTLPSDAGGEFEFIVDPATVNDPTGRSFTEVIFTPPDDYNERLPFAALELLRYGIADNGMTTIDSPVEVRDLDDERSTVDATITLTVGNVNDPPVFNFINTIEVLERDDNSATTIDNFVTSVFGGDSDALDELNLQTVSFALELIDDASGVMAMSPVVSYQPGAADGSLTVFPAPDQFGQATYRLIATDSEDLAGANPTIVTFAINVRPVNDAPRINPSLAGTSDIEDTNVSFDDADEAYAVSNGRDTDGDGHLDAATITYKLREDNTQPTGNPANPVTNGQYFIPLFDGPGDGPYQRVGLLDIYNVGPDNEAAASSPTFPSGGPQSLVLLDFPATTALGGTLERVFNGTQLIGLNYTPPTDFNNEIDPTLTVDSFVYIVQDDNPGDGETHSQATGQLTADRRQSSSTVLLSMEPVNDRPEFSTNTLTYEVAEDGNLQTENFAFGIAAGPSNSAFDELSLGGGQEIEFTVVALSFPQADFAEFFSVFPTVSDNGVLEYQPAPDVFGTFEFEVVLNDFGPDNDIRGDLRSSQPVVLTIDVQPVNDRPFIRPEFNSPQTNPLRFQLSEDGNAEVLVTGDGTTAGLLDVFAVGPENENDPNLPGGAQSLQLTDPIPETTAEGGTLTPVLEGGEIVRFRYEPRAHFVGTDSFIYTITDDGITIPVNSGGNSIAEPRIASGTVTFEVLPINDAPQFSGGGNVTSDEDQNGSGAVVIENWATNVQAGPPGANDEIADLIGGVANPDQQDLSFVFTQISSNPELFDVLPTASLVANPSGDSFTASLNYTTAQDANGQAIFSVRLEDTGPRDGANNDIWFSEERTFTITVDPVNDAPTFVPGPTIRVNEDRGPFISPWATQIVPGPLDEAGQTVRFEVDVDPADEFLFTADGLPAINNEGILTFTPAINANGTVDVRVRAIDSDADLGTGAGVSSEVNLRIVVAPVNDLPVPSSDQFVTDEDTGLQITAAQLLANDFDPDLNDAVPDELQLVIQSPQRSRRGALVTYDPNTGIVTYDPASSDELQALRDGSLPLSDSFRYAITDRDGVAQDPVRASNEVLVTINVNGRNDAPRVLPDTPTLLADGSTEVDVLANDVDIDGTINRGSLTITSQPAFGTVDIDETTGVVTYTPFSDFPGFDSFRYRVADDIGTFSDEAVVTISPNVAPTVIDDATGAFLNEPIIIDVTDNDSDSDGQLDLTSIIIEEAPLGGTATPLDDGTVRYVPASGFTGRDSFTYSVADDEGRRSTLATVDVQVLLSRLQNPNDSKDVNADGTVSALDALLIINHLNRNSSGATGIPVTSSDVGPNFYDVSGDRVISALDILQVINELEVRDSTGSSGSSEPLATTPGSSAALVGVERRDTSNERAVETGPMEAVDAVAEKVVDQSAPADVALDAVLETISGSPSEDIVEERESAVDAALAQLRG